MTEAVGRLWVIGRQGRWLIFFSAILIAWSVLFSMRPDLDLPEGYQLLGIDYLAELCRTIATDVPFMALVAMWGLMALAMMAPSAIPAFKTYDDLTYTDAADSASFWALVSGYTVVWFAFAFVGAGLQVSLASYGLLDAESRSVAPWLNVGLLVLAGLYQFSHFKDACLSKCRAPMMFFMSHWRPGPRGAFQNGIKLGAVCVGCCWALMLLAFVGGTMNLTWMAIAMVLMTLEKLPSVGDYLTWPTGSLLLAVAAWITAGQLGIL